MWTKKKNHQVRSRTGGRDLVFYVFRFLSETTSDYFKKAKAKEKQDEK